MAYAKGEQTKINTYVQIAQNFSEHNLAKIQLLIDQFRAGVETVEDAPHSGIQMLMNSWKYSKQTGMWAFEAWSCTLPGTKWLLNVPVHGERFFWWQIRLKKGL